MTAIDQFLAASLERTIRQNLGDVTVHKIQDRLFSKFGMSITESMQHFEKLDSVLREFFGAGADGLEKRFLENVCCIKSKKDKAEKRFTITDSEMTQSILKAFGDSDSSKILNASIGEPWTINEILERLNIPQTSGYRKINFLIDNGLLIKEDYVLSDNNRKIDKYKSLFDNVNIDINDKMTVSVQFTSNVVKQSSILNTIYNF